MNSVGNLININCLPNNSIILYLLGINPASLSGANVGVFVDFGFTETDSDHSSNVSGLFLLGTAHCLSPNRISYALNLSGD